MFHQVTVLPQQHLPIGQEASRCHNRRLSGGQQWSVADAVKEPLHVEPEIVILQIKTVFGNSMQWLVLTVHMCYQTV